MPIEILINIDVRITGFKLIEVFLNVKSLWYLAQYCLVFRSGTRNQELKDSFQFYGIGLQRIPLRNVQVLIFIDQHIVWRHKRVAHLA